MNDRRRLLILALLIILLASPPFWPFSEADYPEAVLAPEAEAAGACLAPAPVMRAEHGRMLKAWRNLALREGRRQGPWPPLARGGQSPETGPGGLAYNLNTCLSCHTNYNGFCLNCHDRIGAAPGCFDCHFEAAAGKRAVVEPGGD